MRRDDLEALIGRSLRELPPLRAPATLLPRVMAAAAALAQRPWYRRAWLTWPIAWQAVSVAALAVLVAGAAFLWPSAQGAAASSLEPARGLFGPLLQIHAAAKGIGAALAAAWAVWRLAIVPFAAVACALLVLTATACAACAGTLFHIAYGKALPR
jgi:hypothetical protein